MFVEDFNEFFSSDEMADNATIGTATVTGIFESQFVEVNGIEGVRPVFTCAEKDVEKLTHEKTIKILDNTYKVAGRQPDGTGLISLILERQ
tara:strand:+ start:124 stop:396 length:273 start_codon:yes stop_codon:yes gene_type:complete